MLFQLPVNAQEIIFNTSSYDETIVTIDLFRVCSYISTISPNHYIEISNNQVDLTISIDREFPSNLPCDPLPPWINNYTQFNLGLLSPGNYNLNILFVGNSETPNSTNGFLLYPFNHPYGFSIAAIIPTLDWYSLLLLTVLLIYSTKRLRKYY